MAHDVRTRQPKHSKRIKLNTITSSRRDALMKMSIGQTIDLPLGKDTYQAVTKWLGEFQKHGSRRYRWRQVKPGYIQVQRILGVVTTMHGFERLQIGESMLLDLPKTEFNRVRVQINWVSEQTAMRFKTRGEADGLRVTREKDAQLLEDRATICNEARGKLCDASRYEMDEALRRDDE